jgi:hypothetical protein
LLYNIHWFCLFFLLILFITSLNLILINNCEKSKTHVEAVEVQKSREKAVAKKTTAHKTLMNLKENTRKDLEIKFRNEKRLCESLERNT